MLSKKLVKMERGTDLYKLTLMLDPNIVSQLKRYSKEHRLTMSCIVENLLYDSLRGVSDESNAI